MDFPQIAEYCRAQKTNLHRALLKQYWRILSLHGRRKPMETMLMGSLKHAIGTRMCVLMKLLGWWLQVVERTHVYPLLWIGQCYGGAARWMAPTIGEQAAFVSFIMRKEYAMMKLCGWWLQFYKFVEFRGMPHIATDGPGLATQSFPSFGLVQTFYLFGFLGGWSGT